MGIIAKFMPKTRYYLPLYFNNKKYFANNYLTFFSFFFTGLIYWNIYTSLSKIGDIENIIF